MASRGKPRVVSEIRSEPDQDVTEWGKTGLDPGIEKVDPQFEPRIRKAGELILANDWNDMQIELKNDLQILATALNLLGEHSKILLATGIASHGIFIELNWESKPVVMMSVSGSINEVEGDSEPGFRCYPYEISPQGFKVYARSIDGNINCIVNWIAFSIGSSGGEPNADIV